MNPRILSYYAKAYQESELARLKQEDALNHMLGKYIAYAVNKPKDYPRKPFLEKEVEKKPKNIASDEQSMRNVLNQFIKPAKK